MTASQPAEPIRLPVIARQSDNISGRINYRKATMIAAEQSITAQSKKQRKT
jgi:hypothetical protein